MSAAYTAQCVHSTASRIYNTLRLFYCWRTCLPCLAVRGGSLNDLSFWCAAADEVPKRHAILHRLLKSMNKDEPAFIETPFTVDYVRTLWFCSMSRKHSQCL